MRKFLIITVLLLSGCSHLRSDSSAVSDQAKSDAGQVATNASGGIVAVATQLRDNIKVTGEQFRSWLITPPPGKAPDHAIATSYCYHSLTDVLCYRQPIPGWENRLIAYQGTNATPPPLAQTEPLQKHAVDASILTENKVASAKPVFKELPPAPKEEDASPDGQPPLVDPTHEQLPNPGHSPQL